MSNDLISVEPIEAQNKKTIDTLKTLSRDLQDKAIKSALRVSAKPLAESMKSGAPGSPKTAGTSLAQAVNISQAKSGARIRTGAGNRAVSLSSGEFGVIVGPNKKVGGESLGALAMLLEGGAKAHKISSKNNILKLGVRFLRGAVNHPGFRAKNWMTGAFDMSAPMIEQQFYTGLDKWIARNGR